MNTDFTISETELRREKSWESVTIPLAEAIRCGLLPRSYNPHDKTNSTIDAGRILPYIGKLESMRASVLRMLYFEGRTYRATAGELGISYERVRQIEDKALRDLRNMLAKDGIDISAVSI